MKDRFLWKEGDLKFATCKNVIRSSVSDMSGEPPNYIDVKCCYWCKYMAEMTYCVLFEKCIEMGCVCDDYER